MSQSPKALEIKKQLLELSKVPGALSINELRIVLAIERIIVRLETSPQLREHLIFKGGYVMLRVLGSDRFTRDLDALCRGLEKNLAEKLILQALNGKIDDGFWFGDVQVKRMEEQGKYGALRFDCAFQIGEPANDLSKVGKLSRVHFDLGFGDKVPGSLKPLTLKPLIVSGDPVSWRVYPVEFILAEKLEALVSRGSANSRAKDVYDLTLLFKACADKAEVLAAIDATFSTRETVIPSRFTEFAEGLNLRQLKNSWGSVQLSDAETDFETCWSILLNQLKEFDAFVLKRMSGS